jgi:hypothetical protein
VFNQEDSADREKESPSQPRPASRAQPAAPSQPRLALSLLAAASESQLYVLHYFPCSTLAGEVVAMANQNITLSLPEEDLREARILAARRGTSVSQLLARVLRETVERETGYDAARERSLALLREGADLGTGGRVTWSREDLHER